MSEKANSEKTVTCPVEGCSAEKLSRGMYLHVRQSKGGGHGPQGEIPDSATLDNLKTTGSKEVSMDYPDTRETEQVGRRCPFCEEVFRGKQGAMIHLGQVAGKGPHPDNPKEEVDAGELAMVDVDEDSNALQERENTAVMMSTPPRQDLVRKASLEERIQTVIEEFRHEGKDEAADRLEEALGNV